MNTVTLPYFSMKNLSFLLENKKEALKNKKAFHAI